MEENPVRNKRKLTTLDSKPGKGLLLDKTVRECTSFQEDADMTTSTETNLPKVYEPMISKKCDNRQGNGNCSFPRESKSVKSFEQGSLLPKLNEKKNSQPQLENDDRYKVCNTPSSPWNYFRGTTPTPPRKNINRTAVGTIPNSKLENKKTEDMASEGMKRQKPTNIEACPTNLNAHVTDRDIFLYWRSRCFSIEGKLYFQRITTLKLENTQSLRKTVLIQNMLRSLHPYVYHTNHTEELIENPQVPELQEGAFEGNGTSYYNLLSSTNEGEQIGEHAIDLSGNQLLDEEIGEVTKPNEEKSTTEWHSTPSTGSVSVDTNEDNFYAEEIKLTELICHLGEGSSPSNYNLLSSSVNSPTQMYTSTMNESPDHMESDPI